MGLDLKILSLVALTFAVLSMAITLWLVVSIPEARSQLFVLDFPIRGLGEASAGMMIPVGLSAVATLISFFTWKVQIGQVVGGIAMVSWVMIWFVLGKEGFQYLF